MSNVYDGALTDCVQISYRQVCSSLRHPLPALNPPSSSPPPNSVSKTFSFLGNKTHKSLYHLDTAEDMVDIFKQDTDGRCAMVFPAITTYISPGKKLNKHFIMARRNWCEVGYEGASGELSFQINVETSNGSGQTKPYRVDVPAPRWTATRAPAAAQLS